MRPERGGAEMARFARRHRGGSVLAREPDRMVAAIARDDLTNTVFAVERETTAALMNDTSLRIAVDPAVANRLEVERQELKSVRVDAAKVGGAQGHSDEVGGFIGHVRRFQQRASKIDEGGVVDDDAGQSAVNGNTGVVVIS